MGRVFLDSFSGAVADLPKAKHRDEIAVMRALLSDPKVSCFDRSEYPRLDRTLVDLKQRGLLSETRCPYPWHKFHVTPEGLKVLDAINVAMNPQSPK
jgi:hypothetical protein